MIDAQRHQPLFRRLLMKNLYKLIACTLTLLACHYTHTHTIEPVNIIRDDQGNYYLIKEDAPINKPSTGFTGLVSKYALSLFIGAAVGTTIGTANKFIDNRFPILPLTWYLAYKVRHTTTNSIIDTMQEEKVKHCKHVIRDSAWIFSWLSWLMC